MLPLEPYAFGTDQGFEYPGEEIGKTTYFVRSSLVPEQTTILGMLRYLILSDQRLLNTDFSYGRAEQIKMAEAIGDSSFRFMIQDKQDFGMIHKISPVFLMDSDGCILIKNPFHNKARHGYQPMQLKREAETSEGKILLPDRQEYNAKDGCASGYYNLSTGRIINDIFHRHIVSGNRKNGKNGTDEDCYFKRELITLKTGYSFAVYADVDRLPDRMIMYMGQKKLAFLFTAQISDTADNLNDRVKEAFRGGTEKWQYALSDLFVQDNMVHHSFCIVEEKYLRNMKTVYKEKRHLKKIQKGRIRIHLIRSGSVFYQECGLNLKNENCRQIGYNQIVQLGGN